MREIAKRTHDVLLSRRLLTIALQLAFMVASNRMAFMLRFDGHLPGWALVAFWQMLPWLVAIRALVFFPCRLYDGLWRYTSIYDLQALIAGVTTSSIVFFVLVQSPLGPAVYPRSIFITDAALLVLMLGGVRLTRRLYTEFAQSRTGKRVIIFGAGDAAELIVRDMKTHGQYAYHPVGFIDDDPGKVGSRIHGVPVLGTRDDVPRILKRHRPDEVLIAIPQADSATIRSIVRVFEPFKIAIKTLPNLHDIVNGRVEIGQIRNLSVEDLLARAPVGLDRAPLKQLIAGRRVMVTGAGGSIGSELCRQIAQLKPAALLMLERYENSLHAIRMELQDQKLSPGLVAIVADVTDAARVTDVLDEHRPDIIFHAAAHKHVPLMEENPCEAIKNNVRGTRILARAAEVNGVDRFILISTDKAVNPTSVMGASKRLAELVVQTQAHGSGTSFCTVRFGNVLGSNGSVVPRFMDQIRKGGPVTITHPEIRRFFMLIPEAVQLVLHAASHAESGATYVLQMGEQVKLLDMAHDMIRLSGLVPDEDIKIEFVGLRPGEKLYEELVGPGEEGTPSTVEKVLCVRSRRRPPADLMARVEVLEGEAALGRSGAVMVLMKQLVGLGNTPAEADAELAGAPDQYPSNVVSISTEQACPKCAAGRLRRSRTRSVGDRVRRRFTSERPFRCDTCKWRGWIVPLQGGGQVTLDEPMPPNLTSLDHAIPPRAVAHRGSFSPRDLP